MRKKREREREKEIEREKDREKEGERDFSSCKIAESVICVCVWCEYARVN